MYYRLKETRLFDEEIAMIREEIIKRCEEARRQEGRE
jgi:hypothetical protein